MPKILAFSGSGRKNSYNFSIAKCAAAGADIEGVELTIIDMSEFDFGDFFHLESLISTEKNLNN